MALPLLLLRGGSPPGAPAAQSGVRSMLAFWLGGAADPGGVAPPVVTPTPPAIGGLGKRRRILRIKVGDDVFDVYDEVEANRLLEQLRQSAEQTATVAAEKQVAKAVKAKTPAAKERALVPKPPRIVVEFSNADEASRLMQARVEAAQALIEATYRRMIAEAYARFEADEEDVITLLLS